MSCEVWTIIVTYNPDPATFQNVLTSLEREIDAAIVVDNHSANASALRQLTSPFGHEFLELPDNEGIAHAQNVGIRHAMAAGASHILLMDQDTVLETGTVRALLDLCSDLESRHIRVGAVGNFFRDTHDGQLNAIWRAHGLGIKREPVDSGPDVVAEADFIIASGSLIPVATLRETGLMDAGLFIDLVDVEWGLRAAARGYRHFLTNRHVMAHTIGSGRKKLFGRSITLHAPIRDYYALRNALLLVRRPYIRAAWKLYFLRRVLIFFVVFGLFTDQKKRRLSLMFRGITDGIRGCAGRCPLS
ncbi:glycosyltransferase family 2 protein [Acetobacter conturbans]|uniref:Rhamnosyltransferase n=1 Tax=Acetobacter conturbans TaxID=1737472 RepID=A0ABX0JZK6_9PROT|nr:glycosyltransferase family 2 protein [Acetobacter conturbans]NHN88470.1 rhamnosyltransferase [Acetobacter conturbans]